MRNPLWESNQDFVDMARKGARGAHIVTNKPQHWQMGKKKTARGALLAANLPQLQNLIKRDPVGYREEVSPTPIFTSSIAVTARPLSFCSNYTTMRVSGGYSSSSRMMRMMRNVSENLLDSYPRFDVVRLLTIIEALFSILGGSMLSARRSKFSKRAFFSTPSELC